MSKLDTCCRACADEYTLRHVIIQCPVCGKTDCSKAYNHTNPCVWSGLVPGVAAGMIDNPNPQMDDRTDLRAKLQAAEAEVDEIQRQWDQRVDLAERLLAEVARLREALEQIAGGTYEDFGPYKAEEIARAALEVGK